MKIVRVLPYFVSAVSLLMAVSSWLYVLQLDRNQHVSARAEVARADLARFERRDADMNDLIALSQLQRARLDRLAASLHQTRIDVNTVAIGSENLQAKLEARIDSVVKAAVNDLTSLQNQINSIGGTSSTPTSNAFAQAYLKAFMEQMGRNAATPRTFSPEPSPYLDEYQREMARRRANMVYGR